mmetsp:Transcript_24315/g.44632  ORF Transcript_24315/g.44632 Transcript_24315/m.44632 type:complete len:162 (+) Transcript_24315:32-517(+)
MGLLKNLDPLLTADLLYILRLAGHGDEILICDCNFPAYEVAQKTTTGKLVTLAGADAPEACAAICSLLPLDYFVDQPVAQMSPQEGVSLPAEGAAVHAAFASALQKAGHVDISIESIPRFGFYERARQTFAVVQAAKERRPYGNFILKKGVIGPDGKDLRP